VRRGLAALALAAALAPPAARAQSFLLQPGPAGQDSSPYAFIPSLPRGHHETAYAFSSTVDGQPHNFQYYVKFEIPPNLGGGAAVDYAFVWFYYGFGFEGFGASDANPGPGTLQCHRVLQPWSQDTLNWINKPPLEAPFYVYPNVTDFGVVFCKATALVQGWLDGSIPNHGIALTSPTRRLIGMFTFDAKPAPGQIPASLTVDDLKPSLLVRFRGHTGNDADRDRVKDKKDNCVRVKNRRQQDQDGDGWGDACDVCPPMADPGQADADRDGRGDRCGLASVDLDRSGAADAADFEIAEATLGAGRGRAAYRSEVDTDQDGEITEADLGRWLQVYYAHTPRCGLLGAEPLVLLALLERRRRRAAHGALR
jgi:hypothetical protein